MKRQNAVENKQADELMHILSNTQACYQIPAEPGYMYLEFVRDVHDRLPVLFPQVTQQVY